MNTNLTVIIPSFNDAHGLSRLLPSLLSTANKYGWRVLVVDDCSTDNTQDVLRSFGDVILHLRNEVNGGNGYSVKRGIQAADTEYVAVIDADGQHRVEDLEKMYLQIDGKVDALIGNRTKESHEPLIRRPGKWVLGMAANMISGKDIPDINCGLRIFRRSVFLCLIPILPDRFSLPTASLIALLQMDCIVRYVAVYAEPRIGKSTVRQIPDGLHALMLILRMVFLFNPLRVLYPVGLAFLLFATFALCNHLWFADVSTPPIMSWVTGLIIFLFSLLADQVSGIRKDMIFRELKKARQAEGRE